MRDQKFHTEKAMISDTDLEGVSGGDLGSEVAGILTSNGGFYASGDVPKYHVGQTLKIVYATKTWGTNYDCTCVVLAVSETKTCGLLWEEFGYTVQITDAPDAVLNDGLTSIGQIYQNVYEGNLYNR